MRRSSLLVTLGVALSILAHAEAPRTDPEADVPRNVPVTAERRPSGNLRMPGEFERQEAILLAAHELATEHSELFLNLVRAASPRATVAVMVRSDSEKDTVAALLNESGTDRAKVTILDVDHDTMWVRDYGPVFVEDESGDRWVVDAGYVYCDRERDDRVPGGVAAQFGAFVIPSTLELDGGNVLSNGHGLVLTTTSVLEPESRETQNEALVRKTFKDLLGASQVVLLEPLKGESSGHVDMFAMFTAPDTVLMGYYDKEEDPENAGILDRNAEKLNGLPTPAGPLSVKRIPMPSHEDGIWRTYTNSIFVNGALLMPDYEDVPRSVRNTAIDTLKCALPRWDIVPINVSGIIESGGALHCIAMQIPRRRASWEQDTAPGTKGE